MCKNSLVSQRVANQRWSVFGHVLLKDPEAPAQKALDFTVIGNTKLYQGRHGCLCVNVRSHFRTDIKQVWADIKQVWLRGTLHRKTAKKISEHR